MQEQKTSNITTLYNDTIQLKFVESNHSYWISKKKGKEWGPFERATGVTSFIGIKDKSRPMLYWCAKIMWKFLGAVLSKREITKYDLDEAKALHTKFKEQASTIGTKVHDWIEQFIKGQNPAMPEEDAVLQGVTGFLDLLKQLKVKFVASEIPVYSKKYDYCGKLDSIAQMGKKKYLVDFKTSNGIYNDVMLQTAGYVKAYEEQTGEKIHGRFEFRFEKRSEDEFREEMDEKGRPNEPYRAFDVVYLDYEEGQIDRDFEAFLHAKGLFEWNKHTDDQIKTYIGMELPKLS